MDQDAPAVVRPRFAPFRPSDPKLSGRRHAVLPLRARGGLKQRDPFDQSCLAARFGRRIQGIIKSAIIVFFDHLNILKFIITILSVFLIS
jgi:hypothetical protein